MLPVTVGVHNKTFICPFVREGVRMHLKKLHIKTWNSAFSHITQIKLLVTKGLHFKVCNIEMKQKQTKQENALWKTSGVWRAEAFNHQEKNLHFS